MALARAARVGPRSKRRVKTPPLLFDKTQDLLSRIQRRVDGTFLTYWTSTSGSVCDNDVMALHELLEAAGPRPAITLFVKSDGGSGMAALRMIHLLRQYTKRLTVVAPLNCASAATMLALGADTIAMGPLSYLTAVDTSLEHDLSPLDHTNNLVAVSNDEVDRVIRLWKETVRGRGDGVNPYQELYKYLHPLVIGALDRASSLSLMLCREILGYHMRDAKRADRISRRLNSSYPAHQYPITSREARRLGLKRPGPSTPGLDSLLQDLNLLYSEMGQRAITDYDEANHHDNEITNILEGARPAGLLPGGEGLALPQGRAAVGAAERRLRLVPLPAEGRAGGEGEVPHPLESALEMNRRGEDVRFPTACHGRQAGAALLLLTLAGCGGSSGPPTASGPVTTTPPAGLGAGATLSVVSGETGTPVEGAVVTVSGRTLPTDSRGQVTLAEPATPGALVDVVATGFLDRQTLVRSDGLTRHVLWPRTSPTGMDEAYTAELVYTTGAGSSPMLRPRRGTTHAWVVVSDQIRDDDSANAAHAAAVDAINEALQGRIVYALSPTRPSDGVVFESRIDPSDPECEPRTRAYTSVSVSSSEITGGRMVFCSLDAARTPTAAHELGHTFGLRHSPRDRDLMFGTFSGARSVRFGSRETLAIQLMLERRGGNRFPDSDRDVGAGSEGTFTIRCP